MANAKPARKSTHLPTGVERPEHVSAAASESANRLHSLAIHMLRQLRREDDVSGLSAPRLSALSVVVFAGPINLTALAAAEQVRAPTMSRLVRALEAEGLVRREGDALDGRVAYFRATPKGTRLLHAGRDRRVAALARAVDTLPVVERRALQKALGVLEVLVSSLARRQRER